MINAVANNIDNHNVCERHDDDTEELESNCNENLKEIHSNTKVWKAIFAFEEGEMCHEIGTCIGCLSVRPVFHSTKCIENIGAGQPSPIVAEKWKIFKDVVVQEMPPRKIKKIMAATFSGIFSLEDFIPISNLIRHNDMHLCNIPPFKV